MKEAAIIPDPHCDPFHNNDRLSYAGRFVMERQPDYVICVGDWGEMGSLSKYDKGKVSAEGKRYVDDLHAVHDGLEKFEEEINKYNRTHTKWKKKKYNPRKIMCLGNHEKRIELAAQDNPALFGHLSIDDLRYREHGWEVFDLTVPAIIEGIAFAHYFTSGVMGRPISGLNHARSLILKTMSSAVVGHSHLRGYAEEYSVSNGKIMGLVAGCYFDYDMNWTTENERYWRGLVYLHDMAKGYAEPEFLNLETYLSKKFG